MTFLDFFFDGASDRSPRQSANTQMIVTLVEESLWVFVMPRIESTEMTNTKSELPCNLF